MNLSQVALAGLEHVSLHDPAYLTAESGSELAEKGLIQVNPNERDPNNQNAYRVTLTQQGIDFMNSQSAPQAPQAPPQPQQGFGQAPQQPPQQQPAQSQSGDSKPSFEIQSGIEVPSVSRGNASNLVHRESIYPFEQLEIGQSFHVPKTNDDPEPWKKMASNVSAANTRSRKEVVPQQMETVTKRKLRKDANDNPVTDENGKQVYDKYQTQEPKTYQTKKFVARRVDSNDPNGEGCRVFRVPLDPADAVLAQSQQNAQPAAQAPAQPSPAPAAPPAAS